MLRYGTATAHRASAHIHTLSIHTIHGIGGEPRLNAMRNAPKHSLAHLLCVPVRFSPLILAVSIALSGACTSSLRSRSI